MAMLLQLIRGGKGKETVVDENYVRDGEVAHIPQSRRGRKICIFGDAANLRLSKTHISGSVYHFAPDGQRQLPLGKDLDGRPIRSHATPAGREYTFPVRPGAKVNILIQAGESRPAQLFSNLGKTIQPGDRVRVTALPPGKIETMKLR
jgi:hypothetical protein